jgi:hypothetical protein
LDPEEDRDEEMEF